MKMKRKVDAVVNWLDLKNSEKELFIKWIGKGGF